VKRDGSLAGQSVLEGRPLVAVDSETDNRVHRESCRLVGARSFVVVPLFRHGEAVGVLKLQAAKPDVFGQREVTIAQLFAGILAASFADAAETEALRALRASEAELRERLNAIPQMVWSSDADGVVDFFSHSWYDFTGEPTGSASTEFRSDILHPDDHDRVQAEWRKVLASGEPFEIEYRLRFRDEGYRWVLGRALPIRDEQGRIRRWMGTSTDIDDLKRTSAELGRTSALLRLIGDSSPDLIFAKDRGSRLLYANPAAQRVMERPLNEVLGKADTEWATDIARAKEAMANDRRVVSTGETLDVDEVITGSDGQTLYYRSVKAPLRNPAGEIIGLVGITSDITKRRAAEERERLLAREIDHRSKNLLAVVQSVVQLTRADDADSLKDAVMGRIQSLARAHSLLAAGRWEGVDLRQLVTEELAAYAGRDLGQVTIEGSPLHLRPTAAQALGLVIHELATNAVKYGALSTLEGRLAIDWRLTQVEGEEQRLRLRWLERGARQVSAPTRKGFGTTVIRSSVERQLGGRITLDWLGDGLACGISIPAVQIISGQGGEQIAAPVPAQASTNAVARNLGGLRVLVVEDEALVGLQVEQVLRDAGCAPMGPAATILEAIDHVLTGRVEAALLDVNLAGGRSYAVADMLAAKGVPFAFCTGYSGPTDLPERFADALVLTKPLRAEQILESLPKLLGEG
jgi:PAS domain S-box-containing protein